MPMDQDDLDFILLSQGIDELVRLAESLSEPGYAYALWWDLLLALIKSPLGSRCTIERLMRETTRYVVGELRCIATPMDPPV